MEIQLIKLEFLTAFRSGISGKPGLYGGAESTILSDTLFSALCAEQPKKAEDYAHLARQGILVLGDAFPYVGETYFVPKPLSTQSNRQDLQSNKAELQELKTLKKLKYIPSEKMIELCKAPSDELIRQCKTLQSDIGTDIVRTNARIRDEGYPYADAMPYSVTCFEFNPYAGLYIPLLFSDFEAASMIAKDIDALGLTGIGGRRSSGMGKFKIKDIIKPSQHSLFNCQTSTKYMLLSTALPSESEYSILEGCAFKLIKRSGFVDSFTHSANNQRRKDIFAIKSGAIFDRPFEGVIADVAPAHGKHPVYRCLKAFFRGVNL